MEPDPGTPLVFFWDTNFDLEDADVEVKLRFTPEDAVAVGTPIETPTFRVDNNDPPFLQLGEASFVVTSDDRRGIPIPFRVFEDEGETPMPGGGRMRRLRCGDSLIKLVGLSGDLPPPAPPGGIQGGTGYRYWTIAASNLDEIAEACSTAGRRIAVPPTEIRPGVRILIVEDPDTNWVEFVHYADQ